MRIKVFLFYLIAVFLTSCSSGNISEDLNNSSVKNLTNLTMKITSTAFAEGARIPSKYTCDGENINPPLSISNIPKEAKSLVLIVDDPDAPMGTWVHWTAWNINPSTSEVLENSVPANSTEGVTSFGSLGYGGPCPPSGIHRYFFKFYALDINLNLIATAKIDDLQKSMKGHVLDSAQLIGLYERER